jgi:hypothetical protein
VSANRSEHIPNNNYFEILGDKGEFFILIQYTGSFIGRAKRISAK